MKKVALFISSLSRGGAERVVSRLSEILSKDYDVSIIIYENLEHAYDVKVPVINMNLPSNNGRVRKLFTLIKRIKRLKELKRSYGFDCTISFLNSPNLVNWLSGGCVGVSVRNYPFKRQGFLKSLINKWTYKGADFVLPVSKELGHYIQSLGVKPQKIHVIYNPYDLVQIDHLSKEPITEDFFEGDVILSMGRLTYQKAYWHLIKAFSLVRQPAKLVIIGMGQDKEKLLKLIEDLELEDRVLLLDYQSNPFKYMALSQIYVLTSLYEGFPNAMVEAMATGNAIIASDCLSGPEEILDNQYGILTGRMSSLEDYSSQFDTCDHELANKIDDLLSDRDQLSHYKEMAKIRAGHFTYDQTLKTYKKVLENYL